MPQNVVYLHPRPEPVGFYLRVGTSGHRQLETLFGSGKLPISRFVIEASALARQAELVGSLREAGHELILDTNAAELSSPGKFSGVAREAPWASSEGVLGTEYFGGTKDIIDSVAAFAVQHGFNAVHAPTHMLTDSTDDWVAIDVASCQRLRRALDTAGGKHIGIDFPLMLKFASLRDPAQRRALIARLADAPFDNLWMRVSGFGADATAMGLRRYIAAIIDFHRLERPVVADGVGGLVSLAIAAFGAGGGISHGVAEKERFDAGGWNKPPQSGGGGREKRVLINGLDRLLSARQAEVLMEVSGARVLLSCRDRDCCDNGFDDTLKNAKAHYLRQRVKAIDHISSIPETRRAQDFLRGELANVRRIAAKARQLEVGDATIAEVLARSSERLERMEPVLTDLHRTLGGARHSRAPLRRYRPINVTAAEHRP